MAAEVTASDGTDTGVRGRRLQQCIVSSGWKLQLFVEMPEGSGWFKQRRRWGPAPDRNAVGQSGRKTSSIDFPNNLATLNARGRLGSYFSVSMALIVCLETWS
jgi:hypothetical protein